MPETDRLDFCTLRAADLSTEFPRGLTLRTTRRELNPSDPHDETAYTRAPNEEPPGVSHADGPTHEGKARPDGGGRCRQDLPDPAVRPQRVPGHISPHGRDPGEQGRAHGSPRR